MTCALTMALLDRITHNAIILNMNLRELQKKEKQGTMNTNEGGSKTVALMAQKPLDFIQRFILCINIQEKCLKK